MRVMVRDLGGNNACKEIRTNGWPILLLTAVPLCCYRARLFVRHDPDQDKMD